MDILEKLHAEHMVFKVLLKKMVESEKSAQRTRLFAQFKTKLVKHARAEEKAVYDAMTRLQTEEPVEQSNEGYIEHELVDYMLKKLGKARNKATGEWTAGIKVVKELLEHHIEEEEDEIFKTVRSDFPLDRRTAMDKTFEAWKKKVKA